MLPPEAPSRSGNVEGGEGGDSANANTADTMEPLLAGSGAGGCRGAPGGNGDASSSIVLSNAVAQDTRRLISWNSCAQCGVLGLPAARPTLAFRWSEGSSFRV